MNSGDSEPPAEVYRRYLESGGLGYQRCAGCGAGCGAAVFYPRVLCPVCGESGLTWEISSGLGVVYATTAVYRREGDPYNVVLVDLEEGFRMMSRVEGVSAERVEVGASVMLRVDREDDDPSPLFVLRGEGP
ncbi:MAG TPA: OB-fold domain-containing protein [Rubrobacter sp.]|nr:OB-fold domain-containing protein [Rubrobacter sp.]